MSHRFQCLVFGMSMAGIAGLMLSADLSAQTARDLPADIDPESLSRLPALHREDLSEEDRAIWDLVNGERRPTTGPAAVSMHSPKVAEAFHLLNQYLRFNGVLEARDYEVAILQAAWEFEQAYEWSAHEGAARRLEIPDAVIDTIKYDRPETGLGGKDELIIRFARALLREHEVSSELYAAIVEEFGQRGMVDLVTIIGDYVMVGFLMTAADQHLPENLQNTLPER
jgi:4-carboxymuconolactone decarboxylase